MFCFMVFTLFVIRIEVILGGLILNINCLKLDAWYTFMYMKNLDWNLLKSFVAVVQEGSLSGAARALSSTQPTIGRHIEALESQLAISLFVRSREGLIPTEDALDLLPEAQAMLGAYRAFMRKIEGDKQDNVGTVRLAVSEVMGVEVLPGMLAKFHQQYPKINIELSISNQVDNLLRKDADLAIRMTQPRQEALIAKLIGKSQVGLFCHQQYIKNHGLPADFEAIKHHALIGPDEDTLFLETLNAHGLKLTRKDMVFRVDNQVAQLNLIRKGLGIGAMQLPLAKQEHALQQVFADTLTISMPIWLVMHEDLRGNKRVRLVFNFLKNELQKFLE